jgi:hypothetical protein
MASVVGIGPREALFMLPGVVSDMYTLWLRQHSPKREDD